MKDTIIFKHMNIFKSYTFTWWQMGILKLALFCIGATCAVYWNEFFSNLLTPLILIAIMASVYVLFVALKQL